MKVIFHLRPEAEHQQRHGEALAAGFRRHGITPNFGKWMRDAPADIHIIWGWKQPGIIRMAHQRGERVLVMERGFLPDRMQWCSLGWDGLAGRGKYAPAGDNGQRWETYFSGLRKPWKVENDGYVLLIGQVPGDAALRGMALQPWATGVCEKLRQAGYAVRYRPHPIMTARGDTFCPQGAMLTRRELQDDLAGAAACVTYSSTTAVEAVLAGVPTVAIDEGSIAWPVTSHDLDDLFYRSGRRQWCHDLAWRQWTIDELAAGAAWEHVRQCLH